MTESQKPTVGRIVHFYKSGLNHNGQGSGPYAAVVTQVSGDYVNLLVLPPFADSFHEGSVSEGRPGGAASRFWCWPPRDDRHPALQAAAEVVTAA